MEEHINVILEEPDAIVHEDVFETTEFDSDLGLSMSQSTTELKMVTPDIVKDVLTALNEDNGQPEQTRLAFARLSELESVDMYFLNGSLVPRGRFPSATAEKAWNNFHRASKENIKNLQTCTDPQLSRSNAFHLCMKVFQRLVKANYSEVEDQASVSSESADVLTTVDNEILHYIGGSIVHSLRQKCMRAKTANTQIHLQILDCLLTPDKSSDMSACTTLTDMFDRGGLSYIKHTVVGLLGLLEVHFRSKFSSGQCISGQFVKECLGDKRLVSVFYQICDEVQTDELSKERVLVGILKLFFKIRIHNRCKFFMDEYRNKQHVSKKAKSLRKNLKTSGQNSSCN